MKNHLDNTLKEIKKNNAIANRKNKKRKELAKSLAELSKISGMDTIFKETGVYLRDE